MPFLVNNSREEIAWERWPREVKLRKDFIRQGGFLENRFLGFGRSGGESEGIGERNHVRN